MRRTFAVVMALAMAACSGGNSPVTDQGKTLTPKSAAFGSGTFFGILPIVILVVSDIADVCADADSCTTPDGTELLIEAEATGPGTYVVRPPDGGSSSSLGTVEVTFSSTANAQTTTDTAIAGSVTFGSLKAGSSAAGSYDVIMASGAHLTGSFSANDCPAVDKEFSSAASTSQCPSSGTSGSGTTGGGTTTGGIGFTTTTSSSGGSGGDGGLNMTACPTPVVPSSATGLAAYPGGLYVLTYDSDAGTADVIRFTGSDCSVQQDPTFTTGGPFPFFKGGGTQEIAADARGDVFVAGASSTLELDPSGAEIAELGGLAEDLNISTDGTLFTSSFVGDPRLYDLGADGGYQQDDAFAPSLEFVGSSLALSPNLVAVGASVAVGAPWLLNFVDGSGNDAGAYGSTATTIGNDGFCWVGELLDCGGGNVCAVDTNCGRVSVWTPTGQELVYGNYTLGQVRSAAVEGGGKLWVLVGNYDQPAGLAIATGVP